MKLLISQLLEGENAFQFNSAKEGWVTDVIHRVEKRGYQVNGPMLIDLRLTKLEPDYYLRGQLVFNIQQTCARCAENFPMPIRQPFEIALAHISNAKVNKVGLSEESEELDVNFFEGNEIDLSPIVEEQFFLSIPYQSLCRPDCKGMCQQCGSNRNTVDCKCGSITPPNPFSVLQQLKT